MAAKRHARRLRSDNSKEPGRNGGNEDSVDEESGKSGEDAIPAEHKEMPLKLAEEHSPPSPEDAGAQGSGEASPARKKSPSASQEEDEAEDSGDASPPRGPLPYDSADAGRNNKSAATPKRGVKRPPPLRQEEERPETVAASVPLRKKKSERSSEKDTREKRSSSEKDTRKKKKKKQVGTTSTKPDAEGEGIPRKKKKKQEVGTASTKPDEEGEGIPQHGQPSDTSLRQEKNRVQEDEETEVNGEALLVPSKKKLAVERSWSYDDELKILNALVVHAKSHDGALPDSSYLLANLTFDKIDANEEKLTDKIRKMRTRYHRFPSHACPSDDHGRQLFELSEILWGQVGYDGQAEPTSRDFSVLSELYPYLAKEVKAYAGRHSSGDLIMAMFMTIGDEKARNLDAKCKKQQIEAFKLELGQASLTNELLSALSNLPRVKF